MTNRLLTVFLISIGLLIGCDDKPNPAPVPTAPINSVDGIGVAIIVDHSGSMADPVRDFDGQSHDKEGIARRAVASVVRRCEAFAKDHPQRNLKVAVYSFDDSVTTVIPFASPNLQQAQPSIDTIKPAGGTAIGDAVVRARAELESTGLRGRHILVVTDGENNAGRDPVDVAKEIAALPADRQTHVYVMAFDVNSSIFNGVKNAGWNVLSASDAAQLQQGMDTVLGDNILLERN